MFLARVYVTLKPAVNDPQGLTVMGGLHSLGYASVDDVRIGKYLEIRVDTENQDQAESDVAVICDRLLANPVIENYRFTVERVE